MLSRTDFILSRAEEIKQSIIYLAEIKRLRKEGIIPDEKLYEELGRAVDGTYDKGVGAWIDSHTEPTGYTHSIVDDLITECERINQNYGTEKHMVLYAIYDLAAHLDLPSPDDYDDDDDDVIDDDDDFVS